jgi:hypothetical protein
MAMAMNPVLQHQHAQLAQRPLAQHKSKLSDKTANTEIGHSAIVRHTWGLPLTVNDGQLAPQSQSLSLEILVPVSVELGWQGKWLAL